MTEADGDAVLQRPTKLFPLVRHLSYLTTRALYCLPVTPNQITGMSLVLGLGGAWLFRQDDYASTLVAAALLVSCYVLDNSDGEIARLKRLSSEFGKRFDTFVDWIVHAAFFLCLGWGVAERTADDLWLWCGGLAAFGGTVNYVIDSKRDTRERAAGIEKIEDGPDGTGSDRLVFTSRVLRNDFCFIVFALVLVDAVWLLLPAAAIGAQAYWGLQFVNNFRRHHV